jgi:hypothetical protein
MRPWQLALLGLVTAIEVVPWQRQRPPWLPWVWGLGVALTATMLNRLGHWT